MCGIFGVVSDRAMDYSGILTSMGDSIAHRGPDGEGQYIQAGVALGHKRLAIIDPENGKQPMTSVMGEYTVVFNGAIYNYLELRRELISRGHPIRSYSDTEVILYSYKEWGKECVSKFNGMFAFSIWDANKKELFIARDRIGIKPFYYYLDHEKFIFGSEIKAILATNLIKRESNKEALQDYISFQFCLDEKTLFKDIQKLEPGYRGFVRFDGQNVNLITEQYWDVPLEIEEGKDEAYFIDKLEALFEDSLRLRLRSDVPLGAHLSGGLDSSAVASQAKFLLGDLDLNTFTGAFKEGPEFDETGYAKIVANSIGANYQEIYIPGEEFSEVLPKIIWHMDEPLAGPGVVPQYYVSQLASKHVKVALGGQGGDELFIGYARYMIAYLEKCLNGAIYETANNDKYAVGLESIVPNLPILKTYQPLLQRFWSNGLFEPDDKRYYSLIDRSEGMKHLFNDNIFSGSYSSFESFSKIFNRKGLNSLVNKISYFDLKASLPALLHVEDRTSMAASLESRVPLLDHRIVELMYRIPPNIKFAQGRMKHLFKEAIKHKVPEQILNRKDKMGFPVPLNHWYKGAAKEFVADTLLSQKAKERGLYNVKALEDIVYKQDGFSRVTWGLLCMELWHQQHID